MSKAPNVIRKNISISSENQQWSLKKLQSFHVFPPPRAVYSQSSADETKCAIIFLPNHLALDPLSRIYILARSPDNFFHSDILLCTSNFSLIVLFVFRLSNERNALDLSAQCSFVSWRNQWFSSRFRASARPFGTLHGSQWKSPTQSSSVRRFFFGVFRSRKKRFFATVNFGKASAREREDKKFTSRIKKEKKLRKKGQ